MDRPVWPRLDLRAEPADVDVDRAWVAALARASHAIQQLAPGVRVARVRGEHREELELLGAKVNRPSVEAQLVSDEVELVAFGRT